MFHPRKLLLIIGALLFVGGSWFAWNSAHPPLTDRQQIIANIEALRAAVEARNAGGITGFLAEDFTWNGRNKRELNSQLRGGFFHWREVTANVTGLDVIITDDTAIASGKYSITFRSSRNSRRDASFGSFKLTWEKRDGQWLITKAEGGDATF